MDASGWIVIVCTAAFIALVAAAIIAYFVIKKRSVKFKNDEFVPLIKEKFPDWEYDPEGGMSYDEYKTIGCLNWPVGFDIGGSVTYETLDHVTGKTDTGIPFDYCEIDLTKTTTRINSQGNTQTQTTTYFHGGIFKYQHNKTIAHDTFIRGKNVGSGSYFSRDTKKKTKKCETESVEFNSQFKIYSNDIEDVFYFLTPQMMERMIEIKNRYKNIVVAVKSEVMYVIIPGLNLFKTPVFHSEKAIDKYIGKTVDDLNYFVEIPKYFDLK